MGYLASFRDASVGIEDTIAFFFVAGPRSTVNIGMPKGVTLTARSPFTGKYHDFLAVSDVLHEHFYRRAPPDFPKPPKPLPFWHATEGMLVNVFSSRVLVSTFRVGAPEPADPPYSRFVDI